MTPRLPIAVLGGAAIVALLAAVLQLGVRRPLEGGVVAGPGPAPAPGGPYVSVAAAGADPATARAFADAAAGAPLAPPAAPEARAAPPALVVGPGGELAEVPSGLAGRRATKRGTALSVPWDRVAVVARVSELGPLARPVARGLAAARSNLAPCWAAERRALAEGRAPPFDPADPPAGPAVLILDLETRPGGVQVVAANVESLGTSTAELAGCAVQLLSGYRMDAPGAPVGKRFRLMQLLQ